MHSLLRPDLIVVSLLALFPSSVRSQIYLTSKRAVAIYRVNFVGQNLRSLINLDSSPGSEDYWPYGITIHGSQLFWTDVVQEGIYTASLDGSGVRKLIDLRSAFAFRGFSAEGIAVTEDTIFWTDSLNTGVYSARRDGRNARQILDCDEQPLQMLVDGDRLLWTQWGRLNAEVYSSNFDGTNVRLLAAGHGDVGPGIALAEGRLYWTDLFRGGLFTARIDCSGTRKLLNIPDDPSIRWSGSFLAIVPPPRLEIYVRSSRGRVEIEFIETLQSTEDLVTWFDVEPAPSSPIELRRLRALVSLGRAGGDSACSFGVTLLKTKILS